MTYIVVHFYLTPDSEDAKEVLVAMASERGYEAFEECDVHLDAYIPDELFNKDSKRIILSHSRTFEDVQREEKKAAKKPRAKKEDAGVKIENQPAATTLGDIDVLAQLKEKMEKGE